MNFDQKITASIVVGVIGIALVVARRFNNKHHEAGCWIALITILILVSIWTEAC
jgi:hypothetical protein